MGAVNPGRIRWSSCLSSPRFIWLVLGLQSDQLARVDALFVLPLIFLVSQVLAMPGSINRQASADTAGDFACCVLLFYVGGMVRAGERLPRR